MTLKQAFTNWSMAPRNMALAAKSRDAVQKVLMKKYSDIDLEQITETFARRLFKECTESQDFKIKAAAILVYLLCWGGDHGYCQRPTFDYTIAHTDEPTKPKSFTKIVAEMKARNAESETQCLPEKVETKTEETMEDQKQTAVRNKRPVAQIDTKTLQVIKIWPSVTKAHNELHIQNIDRAIHRRGIAGGYFWCDAQDADTFKPASNADKPIGRPKKSAAPEQKPTPDEVPVSVAAAANDEYVPKFKVGDHVWAKKPKDLAGRTGYIKAIFNPKKEYDVAFGAELWIVPEDDLELVVESKFTASVPFPVDEEGRVQVPNNPLIIYDDQQLIDELIRRGYKGTLSITKQITL